MKRYEIKYAVEMLDAERITAAILMHPASFTKAFADRQVNNIYLDSPTFQCFHQNIEGHQRRKKMRLRWYGEHDQPTQKSVLEMKNKDAELGWKNSFQVDGSLVKDKASLLNSIQSLGAFQGELIPTLHNTYHRSYYISSDGLFRITIDVEQKYKMPFSNMAQLNTRVIPVIVELKYDSIHSGRAKDITDFIPFRQTKNSKYTIGVQAIYF